MKLFKQLLVAPAELGLLAPIAANADVSTLSNVENQLADVQAGMFSSTTVMSGSVNFVTGLTKFSLKKFVLNSFGIMILFFFKINSI